MREINLRIRILEEIDKCRVILNEKIEKNKKFEEILEISEEIDNLVSTYYRDI